MVPLGLVTEGGTRRVYQSPVLDLSVGYTTCAL